MNAAPYWDIVVRCARELTDLKAGAVDRYTIDSWEQPRSGGETPLWAPVLRLGFDAAEK
jgi:hypothetical protein